MSEQAVATRTEQPKPRYDLATLGDGQVFVGRDSQGAIRTIKGRVQLHANLGHFVNIQGKTIITKDAYMVINQVAGISFIDPLTMVVDGVKQSNPHVERAPKTRAILSVSIRRTGIGFSPVGNMLAITKSLYWNVHTYFIQDLQAKMKKFPTCAVLGTADKQPTEKKYCPISWSNGRPVEGKEQTHSFSGREMVFYPIEEPVGIWIDLGHSEIQSVFDQHTQRQKFGDRIAQSIIDRNIIADFTGIKRVAVTNNTQSVWVNVYGWKHDLDFRRVKDVAEQITAGTLTPGQIEHRASVVEVEAEEIETETAAAAEAEEAAEGKKDYPAGEAPAPAPAAPPAPSPAPAPAAPSGSPSPAPAAPPADRPASDLKTELMRARAIIGKDAYAKILREKFNVSSAQGLSEDQRAEILKLCHAAADAAAEK